MYDEVFRRIYFVWCYPNCDSFRTKVVYPMSTFLGISLIILMALFVYVSSVVVEEQKRGKRIPLFWERNFMNRLLEKSFQKKANKLFNKDQLKYRDGDNT